MKSLSFQVAGLCASSFVAMAMMAGTAVAQSYPETTVRIVVPYPAGGTADAVARTLAGGLSTKLGANFIVENQGGASGMIGTTYVSQAAADGYTLMLGANNIFSILPHVSETQVDPLTALVPVAKVADSQRLLAVHPSLPYEDIDAFLAHIQESDDLNYASSGIGSTPHILTEFFLSEVGGEMNHIPYPGANPALNDVLAGYVDVMIDTVVIPQVEAGALRGLVVFGSERLANLPDIPTLEEAGLTGIPASGWTGLFAPADTPVEIVAQLSDAIAELYEDEAFRASVTNLGVAPDFQEYETFQQSILSDSQMFGEFIATLDIEE
ncbi:Bug family tripartite tricarboxylate transporter substrate binding protein [Pelagibacterium luteolum]|uniref:Tripartite-type tricarboxylate transporter, receptor component TctC n=1 Tax=Pelagibacterium luteolum TaxID=440168 RepID=A0A1G8ABN5_9HYPH|nr:tripartite tricarboxylate transporter substrate binding protein [Pelagibacterium luteolum]SDH18384.1 Tripartite-type tricarboxylate transporter, receptor component TctC [Pelagibacterium luteolum]